MTRRASVPSVIAVLAAACAAHPAPPTRPAPPPATQPSTPSKPAAHVGDTLELVRIGDQKITVTLTGIVNPATVPNNWGEPDKTYVATQLTITNTGTTTIVGNTNSDVTVTGSDDHSYYADFAVVAECQDFEYGWFLLAVGASTSGCVVFALPSGVEPAKVTYVPSSGISRDTGEWLSP